MTFLHLGCFEKGTFFDAGERGVTRMPVTCVRTQTLIKTISGGQEGSQTQCFAYLVQRIRIKY